MADGKKAREDKWVVQLKNSFFVWYEASWPLCYEQRHRKTYITLTIIPGLHVFDAIDKMAGDIGSFFGFDYGSQSEE